MSTNQLILATKNKDLEKVKELLKNGEDVNITDSEDNNSLYYASLNNYFDIFYELIKYNVNIDQYINNIPLIITGMNIACKMNNIDILKILLNKGININKTYNYSHSTK